MRQFDAAPGTGSGALSRTLGTAYPRPTALVALELARARPPDLALLDVCMPVVDGVALFGEMQVALGDRCPKVLFISATSPEELNRSTALARVAGYVKKPFLLEDLSRAVAGALAS